MTLKIYGIGPSRAARPIWTALELGVPFDLISTPYAGGATRTPEFLAINPNGHIPVLIDERAEGAITVWESMACALYIARVHGKADGQTVAPATPREEAEALRWSFWTVSELEADALTVLMHRMAMPEDQRKPELADKAESRLKVPLAVLEKHLQAQHAKGEAYLAANRFTVADVCVASVASWVRPAAALLAQYPAVSSWLKVCLDRPAQAQARAMK
ncbi:glutathione S-transferase family protein [Limnohabitans sp. 2KL-51]|jgi:glutathione S-transferase|uniref:glutathione S-transferase family protein n=1 Tax=Limnohabitans sp. 2KL-51 TaxID=1977911 RepID=UPI000D3AE2C0|nr:glutathione S-transferase family protein [Limnohabitans sp. 2KL-51]PUE51318.1 glutathione S-transferase [Limnohabitans sp. 2KL-51]